MVNQSNDDTRILLIGSKVANKDFDSYTWHHYPKDLNLADYHIVIFDFESFNSQKVSYSDVSGIVKRNYWNLLLNTKATLYFLGQPTEVSDDGQINVKKFSPVTLTGYNIEWESNKGELFTITNETFANYFTHIKKYQFTFRNQGEPLDLELKNQFQRPPE